MMRGISRRGSRIHREDARAALTLALLAAVGLAIRWVVAPPRKAPGDVQFAPVAVAESSSVAKMAARAADLASPLRPGERVDLNRADAREIARLPGIGPVLAARIVQDRRERGPFAALADLDRVSGIGPKLLEAVRAHAAFSGVPAP